MSINITPIKDEDVEQSVLYCLYHFPATREYLRRIDEDDFYNVNKLIFKYLKNNPGIDVKTVSTEIKESKIFMEAVTNTSLETNFHDYLCALKRISARRRFQRIGYDLNVKALEDREPKSIIDATKKELDNVDYGRQSTISTQQSDIDDNFIKHLEFENDKIIRTGFVSLDNEIGGFFGGTFTAIGGVPKSGKTTLMLNMARNACKQKKKVLFVSLEMSENDIQAKLVSNITGIDSRELRGLATKKEDDKIQRIMRASAEIAGYDLYRIGRKGVSVSDIEQEIENLGGIDILFLDYLQKLKPVNIKENKYNQVSQLSNDVSMLALKYDIPVVSIATINRQHVQRKDGKPSLADFRDSGQIEYDVTAALLLYRCEEENITELNVAANRFGPSNHVIRLKFFAEKSMFDEVDEPKGWNGYK